MVHLLLRSARSEELRLLKTLLKLADPEQNSPRAVAHSHLLYPFWTVTCSWSALAQAFFHAPPNFERVSALQSLLTDLSTRSLYCELPEEGDCGPAISVQKRYSDAAATNLDHLKIDISTLALTTIIEISANADQ